MAKRDRLGAVLIDRRSADADVVAAALSVPEIGGLRPQLVCPGDVVTTDQGYLRGWGVAEREDGKLTATTCGVVEKVNKLIYVRPLKHRYVGSVGDVVVGRVTEVESGRWKLDIGTSMAATLHLAAINLPGNVQRRRTEADVLQMREIFEENDVVCAEVQKVGDSGEVQLQTRSARYGKLQNGTLAKIPATFVRRQAHHITTLPNCNVMVYLGNNGWIWICHPPKLAAGVDTLNYSHTQIEYELVEPEKRERISRVRNCVSSLAAHGLELTTESITSIYDLSVKKGIESWELLDPVRCASSAIVQEVASEIMLKNN